MPKGQLFIPYKLFIAFILNGGVKDIVSGMCGQLFIPYRLLIAFILNGDVKDNIAAM